MGKTYLIRHVDQKLFENYNERNITARDKITYIRIYCIMFFQDIPEDTAEFQL